MTEEAERAAAEQADRWRSVDPRSRRGGEGRAVRPHAGRCAAACRIILRMWPAPVREPSGVRRALRRAGQLLRWVEPAGAANHGSRMTEHDDLNRSIMRRLGAELDRCPRMLTPAGVRAWSDKKQVELGAVHDLIAGLQGRGERALVDARPRVETRPPTPPDVLARNERGGLVGIEVVELVDQQVTETNLPISKARFHAMKAAKTHEERLRALDEHPERVRRWSGREVLDAVKALAERKDGRQFAAESEPYAERWLLIHTSEPRVAWKEFEHELPGLGLTLQQFDTVYVIRDFDPRSGTYP